MAWWYKHGAQPLVWNESFHAKIMVIHLRIIYIISSVTFKLYSINECSIYTQHSKIVEIRLNFILD